MRKTLVLGIMLTLLYVSMTVSYQVVVGSLAPDFTATDIDGNNVTLSDFRGKVVVLDIMHKMCGACWTKINTTLIPFWSEYQNKNVVMITICWNINASELSENRTQRPGMDWILISDPDAFPIAATYDIRTTPTVAVVDKLGYIRYLYESSYTPELTLEQLKEWVDTLLSEFYVVWDSVDYLVIVDSNSTVKDFNFSQPDSQISFNVTGETGAIGFCNVTIPKSLLTGEPWIIKIDDTPITNFNEQTNDTHTFLDFTYTHESPLMVTILGTWVVPEFPQAIILSLFMILSVISVVLMKLREKRQ